MNAELHKNPEYPVELPHRRVLDQGFVALVDVMGDDSSIVQAARVSYGKGTKTVRSDRALISYLMRHGHTTPSEMVEFKFLVRLPVFIARQMIRHRTACLAGDARIAGDLTIGELQARWPCEAAVRSCDESTGEIVDGRVVDVWSTGVRPVFEVSLDGGYRLEMTADHLCLTRAGWKTLGDAVDLQLDADGDAQWNRSAPAFAVNGAVAADAVVRTWAAVCEIRYVGPKPTYDLEVEGPWHNFVANGFIVHNSVNEYSARYSEVPDRFWAPALGAIAEQDTVNRQGRSDKLRDLAERLEPLPGVSCAVMPGKPAVVTSRDGKGLSVRALLDADARRGIDGDRLPAEDYVYWVERALERLPEEKRRLEAIRASYLAHNEKAYALYLGLLEQGVAREIARCVLPLTMYTEWYWKIDLHNLLHFLRLRMDPHAQLEVRAYAEAMAEFVRERVPLTWEAFERDRLHGVALSADEREALAPRGQDAQRMLLADLYERGYRARRLKETCRKLGIDERLVDEMGAK